MIIQVMRPVATGHCGYAAHYLALPDSSVRAPRSSLSGRSLPAGGRSYQRHFRVSDTLVWSDHTFTPFEKLMSRPIVRLSKR